MSSQSSFTKVLPYALVVFFGYVGFSLPLPMLPEMFLDKDVGILPSNYSREWKTILLGIVMSAYPCGQLIGAPILGKCSDLWGRKKVILLSLIGSMIGYICAAFATQFSNIYMIFLGLLFCGLCEGNVAIAQSVVADLVPPEEGNKKISHFGWINLFTCFAFIIGPIIGGQLSDSSLISWFTFSTPFWAASIMTLIGIFVILRFSTETRKKQIKETKGYFQGFREGLKLKPLRRVYLINFFLALGYFSYFRFFPVYTENAFSFNSALLGYTIAYGSITFAIFSALLLKRVANWMKPHHAVAFFSLGLAFSFLLVLYPLSPWGLLWTIPCVGLCLSVVMTYASILVSNTSSLEFQGQAFGCLTSVQVAAEVLVSLFGGWFASYSTSLPMAIGALMLLIATAILLVSKRIRMHHLPQK
jgi:DHA1 family tetracycline resistance protein-like MFS transporter